MDLWIITWRSVMTVVSLMTRSVNTGTCIGVLKKQRLYSRRWVIIMLIWQILVWPETNNLKRFLAHDSYFRNHTSKQAIYCTHHQSQSATGLVVIVHNKQLQAPYTVMLRCKQSVDSKSAEYELTLACV